MKTLKRIFLFMLVVMLIGFAGIGVYIYLESQEREREKAADLAFHANGKQWGWQKNYGEIQVATFEGETQYRKVDRSENYQIIVKKKDLSTFLVGVIFYSECIPGTEIDTGLKYSSGNPKTLECTEEGDALFYGLKHAREDQDFDSWDLPSIDEDLGGFKFSIRLRDIDFKKRDREITLSKAISKEKPE